MKPRCKERIRILQVKSSGLFQKAKMFLLIPLSRDLTIIASLRRDLNSRPRPYQGRALPAEPLRHKAPLTLELNPLKDCGKGWKKMRFSSKTEHKRDAPLPDRNHPGTVTPRWFRLSITPSNVATSMTGVAPVRRTAAMTRRKSIHPLPTGSWVSSFPLLS